MHVPKVWRLAQITMPRKSLLELLAGIGAYSRLAWLYVYVVY